MGLEYFHVDSNIFNGKPEPAPNGSRGNLFVRLNIRDEQRVWFGAWKSRANWMPFLEVVTESFNRTKFPIVREMSKEGLT